LRAGKPFNFTFKIFHSGVKGLLCFLVICFTDANAQSERKLPENKLKAVFLYNFTRFVDWPVEAFANASSPFVIGIVGGDPFGNYMEETVTGENINGHPIVIRRFENAVIENCHILYINSGSSDFIKDIIEQVSSKSVLTVSDHSSFVKWGGMIRFYTEENKIRIQINAAAARDAQLIISSKLLGVAQVY
jgi:hypothetical protein